MTLRYAAAALAITALACSSSDARSKAAPTPAAAAVTTAELGKAAPAFTAVDADGKSRSLSEFAGKVVVLEWNNFECPFVKKHYGSGNMQALQKETTAKGVVWLSVNSGGPGLQGHLDGKAAKTAVAEKAAAPTAYLLDPDGTVGRAYGAKTTPHMYVIDAKGTLVFAGGIDDKPSAKPDDVKGATNWVRQAVTEVLAGKSVSNPSPAPYGCSVKYASS